MNASIELVVARGPCKGQILSLDGRRSVTIGRAPDNTLVLSDERVSAHHARLDVGSTGVILTDLGSRNGTFAGGKPISGSREIAIGMEIALGGTVIEIRGIQVTSDPSPVSRPSRSTSPNARRPTAVTSTPGECLTTGQQFVLAPAMHPSQSNLTKPQRNLAILTEVGDLLSTERDADRFLERLMDLIFDVLPSDRGVLLLVDETGEARPHVTRRTPHADGGQIHVSRTILSKVIGGVSILTADAGADARLANGASIAAGNIRSAMCVPIRGRRKCVGAIYVDTVISVGVFGKDDLEMLSTVGVLTGTALENIQLFRENLQQERMAAIGKVIAGLGHDIRNLLSALKGGMYLVDETLRGHEDEDARCAWDIVKHGHESISNLVQDMVNYSKPREPDWKMTDVNQVAEAAIAFARGQAKEKNVQISVLLDPTIEPFYFDAQSIERCVLNLLTNAVDAVQRDTGVVGVQTRVDDARRRVCIVVQDNGEGIPAENRDRVFDLLFSTKGRRGTGFGLAITKKIVEEHEGRVWFSSDAGKGTAFTIELPLRESRPVVAVVV
jgi:signal transduction histidine kinase/pSer/pThr/pTyr-binding forkhead associated (FHA) protein